MIDDAEKFAEEAVFAGLVGWAGSGPCPCNITLRKSGHSLANNSVVFTVEDAAALKEVIAAAFRAGRESR